MNKKIDLKRYVLCVVGLMISGFGVALTKKGELGVSPVSSVANVLSIKFDSMSLGTWLIIWNCLLILGQMVLLRKKFKLFQFLQIPLSFVFGLFTDMGLKVISGIPVKSYAVQLLFVAIGTVVVAFGVSVSVKADVIYNSGEAFVKAVAETFHKEFSTMKMAFDITCVVLAVVLSMVFFRFKIVGTREGTVIAALFTGMLIKTFGKMISKKQA